MVKTPETRKTNKDKIPRNWFSEIFECLFRMFLKVEKDTLRCGFLPGGGVHCEYRLIMAHPKTNLSN